MLWLACHNPKIDWKTGEVKMIRCPEEYGKQQRPKQRKSRWQKQKKEEAKEEVEKKQETKTEKKIDINSTKRHISIAMEHERNTINIKRVAKKWEIQEEKEETAKSEAEAKKLVPEKFHKWIKVFGKKQSEQVPTRKT